MNLEHYAKPVIESKRLYFEIPDKAARKIFVGWFKDPDISKFLKTDEPMLSRRKLKELRKSLDTLPKATLPQSPKQILVCEKPAPDSVNPLPEEIVFTVIDKESGLVIGAMALHLIDWENRHAYIRTVIGRKEFQIRGYGREAKMLLLKYAFEFLNLRVVRSHVLKDNSRGFRTNQSCGFQTKEILKGDLVKDGELKDTVAMEISLEDWPEAKTQYLLEVKRREEKSLSS